MTLILSSCSIEIQTEDLPTPKDLHFLRQRLQEAFNELAPSILEEVGILDENTRVCHLDEFEVQDESEIFAGQARD